MCFNTYFNMLTSLNETSTAGLVKFIVEIN
jgi:hypothetical protein